MIFARGNLRHFDIVDEGPELYILYKEILDDIIKRKLETAKEVRALRRSLLVYPKDRRDYLLNQRYEELLKRSAGFAPDRGL